MALSAVQALEWDANHRNLENKTKHNKKNVNVVWRFV